MLLSVNKFKDLLTLLNLFLFCFVFPFLLNLEKNRVFFFFFFFFFLCVCVCVCVFHFGCCQRVALIHNPIVFFIPCVLHIVAKGFILLISRYQEISNF